MFDPTQLFIFLLSIPAVLFTLTIHEVSHGYAAYRLGDPTAKAMGRLSLNPLRHLDPFGALCMLLFRFGWARPVPVNTRYFKKPRRDMALTAAAGPLSNLITGVVALFLSALFWKLAVQTYVSDVPDLWYRILNWTAIFFYLLFSVNIGLAVFNLIPIPPLDGSRIFALLLPPGIYVKFLQYERYISIGLTVLLLVDLYVGFGFVSQLMSLVKNGLANLVGMIPYFEDISYFLINPVIFK